MKSGVIFICLHVVMGTCFEPVLLCKNFRASLLLSPHDNFENPFSHKIGQQQQLERGTESRVREC